MDTALPHERARLLRLATIASTATALLLVAVKFAAWLATGSVSVMASLVDSLMDGAASFLNLLAVRYSLRSADEDHQFGHGKAESLAALAQASFIAGSAIFLVIHAAERLARPQPLQASGLGMAVMAFAILATLLLLLFQGRVVRRTGSEAIRADALHYQTDLFTNLASMAALFLAGAGFVLFDPLCALGIAAYILHSAWRIGRDATQVLMDRELPPETRQAICALALAHPAVLGVHDLRTRQSGATFLIQLHLDLDRNLPLFAAHQAAKEVERTILEFLPQADVIIHQDPVAGE